MVPGVGLQVGPRIEVRGNPPFGEVVERLPDLLISHQFDFRALPGCRHYTSQSGFSPPISPRRSRATASLWSIRGPFDPVPVRAL